jgi:ubiquinone/menaquinone biosynthesis C-methylase UbiE
MKMTQAATAYFERVANDWDELRAGYFSEAVREAAIAHAYLRPEMTVADVGCGTGFLAAGLAPKVAQVHALDGAPAMIEAARRNLTAFTNVVYHVTDGGALPLEDASVDAALANMYLHHRPDPAAALREMARLLRPGGRLVVTDLDRHTHEWLRAEMADEWLGFDRVQVKEWLRAAGLVNVLVDSADQACSATSQAASDERAEISVFVATGTRRVTGAREAVQANYGALAQGESAGCASACCAPADAAGDPAAGQPAASCCGDDAFQADIPLSLSCCAAPPTQEEFTTDIPLSLSCCAADNAMPQIAGAPAAAEVAWQTGYTAEQLAAVPPQAAEISLGCGNPGALASLLPGEVVLDIGSGGGIDAFYAAQRVGATGRVIGLDMTPAMIERARRTAAEAGLTNVEFRLGQAEAMPVADATADVILSNCVINLCEDKGRVFEEAFRVLKPGGRLAISDTVADGALPLSLRGDPGAWSGCISGALPEREYLNLVAGAGFRDVQAKRSLSGGRVAGVTVYSLSVTATRPAPAAGASA